MPQPAAERRRVLQAVRAKPPIRLDGIDVMLAGTWAFALVWKNDPNGKTADMKQLILRKHAGRWDILATGTWNRGERPVQSMPRSVRRLFDRWVDETTDYE